MSRLVAFGLEDDGDGGGSSGGGGPGSGNPNERSEIRVREPHVREADPATGSSGPSAAERAARMVSRIDNRSRDREDYGTPRDPREGGAANRSQGDPGGSEATSKHEITLGFGSSGFAQYLMLPAVGYQAMGGVRSGGSAEAYGGGFVGAGGLGVAFFLPGATISVGWARKATQSNFTAACQPAVVVSVAIFQLTMLAVPSSPDMKLDSVSLSASEGLGLGVVGGIYCGTAAQFVLPPPDAEAEARYFIQRK